jgi:hypothetical protein
MYLATVDWLTSTPSFSNSPWIRGAPQRGFASDMRRISARTSGGTDVRPIRRRLFQLQNERKARRCQAITVSGLTMTSVVRHPFQTRHSHTHIRRSA